MSDVEHLFVVGLGRSGTTALTQVLSGHAQVVLGMERFKKLWNRIDDLTPEYFTEERFFDFSDNLTNITPDAAPRWMKFYEKARSDFAEARFVGDKLTEVKAFPRLIERFPRARFVCIIRDSLPLAWSWEQRANNPEDKGWPAARNAVASVGYWNEGMRTMRNFREAYPEQTVVVEYDTFFGSPEPVENVYRFLDIKFTPDAQKEFREASLRYLTAISSKDRVLEKDIERQIGAERDDEVWRDLIRISV